MDWLRENLVFLGQEEDERTGGDENVTHVLKDKPGDGSQPALYPPGRLYWIEEITKAKNDESQSDKRQEELSFKLHHVRDRSFLNGILLSPDIFRHHFATVVLGALETLAAQKKGNRRAEG